jgi:hypothetical protein
MEQSLHWNWFETQETKHSSENKVSLDFRHLIFYSNFASVLFLIYFNCKFFLLILDYFWRFVSKIILFQESL